MSLNYVDHQRTRYLKSHYEIYDYRKEKLRIEEQREAERREVGYNFIFLDSDLTSILQREENLKARQEERARRIEKLIEENRQFEDYQKSVNEKKQLELQERIEERRSERETLRYDRLNVI